MPSTFIFGCKFFIVFTISSLFWYIKPYLPKPVSIFICVLRVLPVFAISFAISALVFDPIVMIILLSTNSCISSFIDVQDIFKISMFLSYSLSSTASEFVATASMFIPLSIKN